MKIGAKLVFFFQKNKKNAQKCNKNEKKVRIICVIQKKAVPLRDFSSICAKNPLERRKI